MILELSPEDALELAVQNHRLLNRSTVNHWDYYTSHREATMELILSVDLATLVGRRLCLLGAGNTNDIDLALFAELFAEIHLVDLDGEALHRAVVRQHVQDHPAIHLHSGVDVTGIAPLLLTELPASSGVPEISPLDENASEQVIRLVAAYAENFVGVTLGTFDVVVSCCLISQLNTQIERFCTLYGASDSARLSLLLAVRQRHFRLMAEMLRPGGFGILTTDVVSSETLPSLLTIREPQEIALLLIEALMNGEFFAALNPNVLLPALQNDTLFTALADCIDFCPPWRWNLNDNRSYLTYGVRFRRKPLSRRRKNYR